MKHSKIYIIALLFLALLACVSIAQNRVINLYRGGEVIQSYAVTEIDSLKVEQVLSIPGNVSATISGNTIVVKWDAVSDAQFYEVYRSSDNVTYTILSADVLETTYTDAAPLSGTNYYKVRAISENLMSDYSLASNTVEYRVEELASGLYLGITGFNQQLYSYPVQQLNSDTKLGFDSFVDGMTMKNGTILYYSVDEAITTLQSQRFPSDLFNVAIVTFTDGLDQGSMMINSNYFTDEEYLNAINNRIVNEKVSGQSISAYSIGIRGSDVSDVSKFQSNLQKLASSAANAFEVSSMSEVNTKFQEIANQLTETSFVQSISLKMPGQANGTKVRFTFDNVTTAERSRLYIEGIFNLKNKTLENIVYYGLTSTSGATVQGTVDGIFVNFTFEGVRTDDKQTISRDYINEWTYIASTSSWQINSEFDKEQESDIVTEKKSAAIMLILDCSSSLGNQFTTMQTNAKSFINTLCTTDEEQENPDTPIYPSDNFSTVPADLTLAISKDSVRYYLTQEEYKTVDDLSAYTIEGVTVISGSESFIIDLKDATCSNVTWAASSWIYEGLLPSYNEGVVISSRWSAINAAVKAFGGTAMSGYYWTTYSSSYDGSPYSTYDGKGSLYKETNKTKNKIRFVKSVNDNIYKWYDERDLKLAIKKDGVRYFLSESEYSTFNLTGYEVEGVAIVCGGYNFIISLYDADCGSIYIDSALTLYGSTIPSKSEGIIMGARWSYINKAIKAFGGIALSGSYWTSYWYEVNGLYYYASDAGGPVTAVSSNKTSTCKVRTVTRF